MVEGNDSWGVSRARGLVLRTVSRRESRVVRFTESVCSRKRLKCGRFGATRGFVGGVGRLNLHARAKLTVAKAGTCLGRRGGSATDLTLLKRLSTLEVPRRTRTGPRASTTRYYKRRTRVTKVFNTTLTLAIPRVTRGLSKRIMFFTAPTRRCNRVKFGGRLHTRKGVGCNNKGYRLLHVNTFSSVSLYVACRVTPKGSVVMKDKAKGKFMSGIVHYLNGTTRTTKAPRRNMGTLSTTSLNLRTLNLGQRAFHSRSYIHIRPVVAGKNGLMGMIPSRIMMRALMETGAVRTFASTTGGASQSFRTKTITVKTGIRVAALPKCLPALTRRTLPRLGETTRLSTPRAGIVRTSKRAKKSASINSIRRLVPMCAFGANNMGNKLRRMRFRIASRRRTCVIATGVFTLKTCKLLGRGTTEDERLIGGCGPMFRGSTGCTRFVSRFSSGRMLRWFRFPWSMA